jgi:glycerophosphoryl diester phosphodiesterase
MSMIDVVAPGLAPVAGGRRRVLCCHRASLDHSAPPNSLEAVRRCVAAGAPRIEVDVRWLADDELLVFHDPELDAETTATGPVASLVRADVAAIRYLDIDGTPLCFLDDVVAAIDGSDTLLQVDLKGTAPLTPARVARLAAILRPIRAQALVGSQAHWNLRLLREAGCRVAFDPTLHWHYRPGRRGDGLQPAALGQYGLWDDSPLAAVPGVDPAVYVRHRVADLLGLVAAEEWMVDYATIRQLAALGVALGDELAARGVELAAWTVHDEGQAATAALVHALFALGVTTIITDAPLAVARYLAEPATK